MGEDTIFAIGLLTGLLFLLFIGLEIALVCWSNRTDWADVLSNQSVDNRLYHVQVH